jgi:hypothetical protein
MDRFLATERDNIGKRSSVDLRAVVASEGGTV